MKYLPTIAFSTILAFLAPLVATGQVIEKNHLPLQLIDDVSVASLETGVVTKLQVTPGDLVEQGDVLLELDHDLHEGQANVKHMALRVAEAEAKNDIDVRYSEKTLKVNGKILEKSLNAVRTYAKSISETEIDKLRLERDQSELSIEQAEVKQKVAQLTAQLRDEEKNLAEINLARRTIRSPLDGVVVDVTVKRGEAVAAAKPVIRIISTRRLRVIASVDRKFAFKLQHGDLAEFEVQTEEGVLQFPAKVVFVSPEIRFTEQTFDVWIEVENDENKLLPGMKGNLKIDIDEGV